MNVLIKVLILQWVMINAVSCVTDEDSGREFSELDTAEDLTCHQWFLDEKTLGVYDLFMAGLRPHSFVAKVRRRDNSIQYHHRVIISSGIDEKNTTQLFVPEEATVLGHYQSPEEPTYLVTLNPEDENRLEFRSLPENKIRYKDPNGRGEIFSPQMLRSRRDFWFAYRQADEDTKSYLALYKRRQGKGQLAFDVVPVKNLSYDIDSDLIVPFQTSVFLFQKQVKGGRVSVTYRHVDQSGKVGPSLDLNLPVKSDVDSWSAVSAGASIYIAVVDGEAFLRQATLRVAKISISNDVAKVEWLKSRSLMDVNVSQPIFQTGEKSLSVLVPKWLDGKSTLARYNIEKDGIAGVGHVGEFPKASRITDSYFASDERKSYFVVRIKDNVAWQFRICELE